MKPGATIVLIVLADDEQFIRLAYKEGLERAGFKLITAADGEEALEKITKNKPDLVLLDLIMPKKNGFDVLKALKADGELSKIPVAVLSNLSQTTDEAEVKSLGAIDFVVKSDHSMKEIIEKVKSYGG